MTGKGRNELLRTLDRWPRLQAYSAIGCLSLLLWTCIAAVVILFTGGFA